MFSAARCQIDPTQLTASDSQFLYLLLKQRGKQAPVLLAGQLYRLALSDTRETTIVLTHTLVRRTNDKGQARYSVISNEDPIGKGQYGTVHRLTGTLVPQNQQRVIFKNNKNRVIKIQDMGRLNVDKDERLSRAAPHLNAKKMTCDNYSLKSYLVMDELRDTDLYNILDEDRMNQVLNMKDRLWISLYFILAVLRLHQRGILHCDLKPENIRVNRKTLEVGIVDFGFAEKMGEDRDKRTRGNYGYVSIDTYMHGSWIDLRSEVYSVGLILAVLWGGEGRGPFCPNEFHRRIKSLLAAGKEIASLDTLFKWMKNRPPLRDRLKIRALLTELTNVNIEARGTLEKALKVFSEIALTYEIENSWNKLPEAEISQLKIAHAYALDADRRLRALAEKSPGDSLESLQNIIDDAVDKIADTNLALEVFLDTLRIKSLQGLTSKAAVKEKTNTIIRDFAANQQPLRKLLEQAANELEESYLSMERKWPTLHFPEPKKNIAKIQFAIHAMLSKRDVLPMTLDDMAKLNRQYLNEAAKFQVALTEVKDLDLVPLHRKIGNKIKDQNKSITSTIHTSPKMR